MSNHTELEYRENDVDKHSAGSWHLDIVAVLCEYSTKVLGGSTQGDYRFRIQTKSGANWRTQMLAHEEAGLLRLIVHLDLLYSPKLRPSIMELVCRANSDLILGSFEFCWETGAVSFRHTLDVRGETLDRGLVERLLDSAAFPLALFERASGRLTTRGTAARVAWNASMVEEDATNMRSVAPETRKVLLSLHHGSAWRDDAVTGEAPTVRLLMEPIGELA